MIIKAFLFSLPKHFLAQSIEFASLYTVNCIPYPFQLITPEDIDGFTDECESYDSTYNPNTQSCHFPL